MLKTALALWKAATTTSWIGGGFGNDLIDPGGAPDFFAPSTKSLATLVDSDGDVDADDIMALDKEQAYALKIKRDTTYAIQALLDAKAKEYHYDNIHMTCGWAGKLDDATALRDWGTFCWLTAGKIEADVLAGKRSLPTVAEVIAEMPEFTL